MVSARRFATHQLRRRDVDTYVLTPTSIHRWLPGQDPEIMNVEAPDGSRAVVLLANPEAAESFRQNTGRFPADEGWRATVIDHEAIQILYMDYGRFRRLRSTDQSPTP